MTHGDVSERRLIQLLCGTEARRQEGLAEMSRLMGRIDPPRLVDLLKRVNLLVLIGNRLLALGFGDVPELTRELESFSGQARRWGTATELASLEVLDRLSRAGIRALPLKGSLLALELYGDVATRTSMDIDVLVAPEDLPGAVATVSELGWRWERDVRRMGGLPALHETLMHPTLPRVELHWRVHWYERRFAADALERAAPAGSRESLRMQPLDGLIALMLFYARDGFSGLRFPADVAAWWDLRCAASSVPSPAELVTQRYPALAAPVTVASRLLSELVGVPAGRTRESPFRWRVAAGLASPFLDGGRQQAEANAGLTDLLLAPPRTAGDAMLRVLHNAPVDASRQATTVTGAWRASASHIVRVARRWALAFAPAVVRSYTPRRLAR
jgi:hypothetical protein